MALDFTEFVDRGAAEEGLSWDKKYKSNHDPSGGPKLIQTLMENYFNDYVTASDAKMNRKVPDSAVAETGGFLGNNISAGNLGNQSRTEYTDARTGKFNSSKQPDMDKIYEDLSILLHEVQHTRLSSSKDPKIMSYGIGKAWNEMLKDKDVTEAFPSVGSKVFAGDNLDEFLASALVLDAMTARGIPVKGRMEKAAKLLPELKKKYDWLPSYLKSQRFPESPTLKESPPPKKSLLDRIKEFAL